MNDPYIRVNTLIKNYQLGRSKVEVLRGLDLDIQEGEALCIMGSSGAGKSTFLHILGTLDDPSSGNVYYRGQDVFQFKPEKLAAFRNENMGFVFQFHHLLNEFTAAENVMIPARIGGFSKKAARVKAEALLDELGLSERATHLPSELSGGEQQRVAVARALIQSPEVLFADEPTGNLDSQNGKIIEDLFFRLHEERKLTLVVVSHDIAFSKKFPRVLRLKDGMWESLRA